MPDIHHNSEPPPGSDRSPEDRMTAGATAVWIYAELAKSRGISRRSAERLAQRHHWPRRPGNDGTTRVGVPAGAYKPTDRAQGDDRGADQGDAGGVIAALRDAFATALGARDGEICVMSETPTENKQVEGLRQERDRALADLQAAQIAQAEADAAELRQADATRRARGRWARIRAAWTRGIVLWLDEFYLFWR